MKTIVKGAIRDEKGAALALVLVLLVVGGLILTPLLGLMGTGLMAGQVYEKKTDELYAADAGVEDAIWRIQTNNLTFDANNCSEPWHLTVNDRSVEVVVYRKDWDPTPCGENMTYQILSTSATGDGGGTASIGSSTTIDAHIVATPKYYPSVMDQLVTIQGNLTKTRENDLEQDLAKKLNVTCPATCTDCAVCRQAYDYYTEYDSIPAGCRGCVAVYNFPEPAWPTVDSLSSLWSDAQNQQPDGRSTIDLNGNNMTLGPLKGLGNLEIKNTGSTAATLTLTGSVYLTGDTLIDGPSASQPYKLTIDLNHHTIFVSNNTSKALEITQCNVRGPGIIVALGDIKFAPKLETGATSPVFVISLLGSVKAWPSGDFYGAVAGKKDVDLSNGKTPSASYPKDGFDYRLPRIVAGWTSSIASWEINPK